MKKVHLFHPNPDIRRLFKTDAACLGRRVQQSKPRTTTQEAEVTCIYCQKNIKANLDSMKTALNAALDRFTKEK